MEIKFDVYFKKNLGTLFKSNEVDLDGILAHTNLDLKSVDRLEANYKVGTQKYTDSVGMVDIEERVIQIPFKSDVVKVGLNEFEIVAYMLNGDIKTSQTYTYNIDEAIGEGKQAGSGGSSDGHTHSNLAILNSITQSKIDGWDNKADSTHSHSEYASATHSHGEYANYSHTHNASEIEGLENVDIDLSTYARKDYVDNAIEEIKQLIGSQTNGLSLTYNYSNQVRGNAQGTISLSSNNVNDNGVYNIYWSDAKGRLDDYDSITTLTLEGANPVQTYSFISTNAIPVNATSITAIGGNAQISIDIPQHKRVNPSDRLYSFGLLSDVHVDGDGDDEANSNSDLQKIFNYYKVNEDIDFVAGSGDITRNGRASDCIEYNNLINNYLSPTPIYTCRGNHDCMGECSDVNYYVQNLEPNGIYYSKEINGDLFLFVGMPTLDYRHPFSEDELDWLQKQLEANRNKRVFIFEHLFVGSGTGNPANLYPFQGALMDISTGLSKRFYDMISHYKNAILFTGHSHFDFSLQRIDVNANCALRTDNMCHRVHTPSSANPRKNDIDTEDIYSNTYDHFPGSQGYIVDVYDNFILLRGRDFEIDKFIPLAQYIIDTTPINIQETVIEPQEPQTGRLDVVWEMYGIADGYDNTSVNECRTNYLRVDPTYTYTLSQGLELGQKLCVYAYDSNKTFIERFGGNDGNYINLSSPYTLPNMPNDTAYIRFRLTYSAANYDLLNQGDTRLIVEATSNTNEEPTLEELDVVWEMYGIADGYDNTSVSECRTNYLSVDPSCTYILTDNKATGEYLCVYAYDSNKEVIERFGGNSGNYIIGANNYILPNMPSNTAYIRFRLTYSASDYNTLNEEPAKITVQVQI